MKKFIALFFLVFASNILNAQNLKSQLTGKSQKTWKLYYVENIYKNNGRRFHVNSLNDYCNGDMGLYFNLPYEISFLNSGKYRALYYNEKKVKHESNGTFELQYNTECYDDAKDKVTTCNQVMLDDEDRWFFTPLSFENGMMVTGYASYIDDDGYARIVYKLK